MSSREGSDARFTPTHWSVVLAARQWPEPHARDALTRLCEIYWFPLYAFLRRRGHAPHEAQDLTQSFFVHLFERGAFQRVAPEKGTFRSFLLGALGYFVQNERDRQRTIKRGGRCTFVSWDEANAEEQFQLEPTLNGPDEALFDRQWALTLLKHVLARLEREYAAAGKAKVFAELQGHLTSNVGDAWAEVAVRLKLSEGSARVALHRLRRRFGEMVRTEIAQTVTSPDEIEAEVRHLFSTLAQ